MSSQSTRYWRLAFEATAFCILLLVSYSLVIGVYKEYQESKTYFVVTKEPVTVDDNPAILVKLIKPGSFLDVLNGTDVRLGHDIIVNVLTWDEAAEQYIKDPNDIVNYLNKDKPANVTKTKGKNYIEISSLKTANPNVLLLMIRPLKTSQSHVWKKFDAFTC